jgi:ubiquitin thioesterase protein OTUB1
VLECDCDMSAKLTWVQGPLVGEKRSSLEITEEYAKADPIYVAKTMVRCASEHMSYDQLTCCQTLPRIYSHYRPVKGDGNCGWRGLSHLYHCSTEI